MRVKLLIVVAVGIASLSGQRITDRQTANVRGGGGQGKCTIEVLVDDVAQVEIYGRNAVIRTISGAPSSFRRFECNQEMPNRPYGFRFAGVDGRGRQDLVNSPENGGPALIRIEDSKGGNEGYTFDIFWNGGNYSGRGGGFGGGGGFGAGGFGNNNGGGFGGNSGWNNGWGNGSGWNNTNFNYSGRGTGSFQDLSGQRKRLDVANVFIANSGNVTVSFDGENGRIEFGGQVTSRNNRRVFANVNGGGRNGTMTIEMSAYNQVRSITLGSWNLTWAN
jgi:hypothetical protein